MTAILFDFFGTLAEYSPSRTGQGYPHSYEFLRSLGADLSYSSFLAVVDSCFADFDRRSDVDDSEFAMSSVAAALLDSLALPASAAPGFERHYIAEWSAGVTFPEGLPALLEDLRSRHRMAVVSNTHSPTMVPSLLATAGLSGMFDAVVLSVDLGRRKPHPRIYAAALAALDITPADAVFVGDSYQADYLGPSAAGIPAFLITPAGADPLVPADRRLSSVFDLPARLNIRFCR
jgi:putative hydrolase of the HAD superfamily